MDRLGGGFGPYEAEDPSGYEAGEGPPANEAPPSPVGQDERRMQVRAYNHWASLLGNRTFPQIEDLNPEELQDFGPYSVLLDFSAGVDNPAVRYLGPLLSEECDVEGQSIETLSDVPSRSLLSRITDHYLQIIANQAPIGFEAEFVNQRGQTILYRGILLPYSSDNETIDFIYGVINWKEMADQQTADALLLEIDQTLADYDDEDDEAAHWSVETPENLRDAAMEARDARVFELGTDHIVDDLAASELPQPAFGYEDATEAAPVRARGFDALGNRIGDPLPSDDSESLAEDEDDAPYFDNSIKTAADYGLPDWDEEPEGEDVDDVVDPLGEEELTGSLTSLVSRGMRTKKAVDLSVAEPRAAIPQAYEGEAVPLPGFDPVSYAEPVAADGPDDGVAGDWDGSGTAIEGDYPPLEPAYAAGTEEFVLSELHSEEPEFDPAETEVEAHAIDFGADSPAGLYDCLASAREMAQAALNTEDRSRKALYAAVGRAYDFSLEAAANPAEYEDLIADSGLTIQDRAPMTPIVKLVFGTEYDKTRLTEYAAVLTHAHRVGVARGELVSYLRVAEGGLKGVLNAERRARKEEQGKPVEERHGVRAALAKKLRKLEPTAFEDLAEEGPEFALVMVRRSETGELVVIGELPEDVPMLEKAARKLLG